MMISAIVQKIHKMSIHVGLYHHLVRRNIILSKCSAVYLVTYIKNCHSIKTCPEKSIAIL